MHEDATRFLLWQLAASSPALVVYLIGFVLAAVLRRRQPFASTLTLIGLGLLLVGTVSSTVVMAYLDHRRIVENLPAERHSELLLVSGIANSIIRTVGLALVVAAVFVGRDRSIPVDAEQTSAAELRDENARLREQLAEIKKSQVAAGSTDIKAL